MAIPGDLATVVVTGTFLDPGGFPLGGFVSFVPSVPVADPGDSVMIWPVARTYQLSEAGTFTSDPLVSTTNGSLEPPGWTYTVTIALEDYQPPQVFQCYIPSSPDPVDISELTPVQYVPEMAGYLPLAGGTMLGPLYAAQTPVAGLEVATKGYVDSVTAGLAAKPPVRLATTTALPANTATALTLTANFVGVLTVDTVTPNLNDRILVKNEAAQASNGIYYLSQAGSVSEPYILTRSADMDTAAEIPGAYAFTEDGSANTGFGFIVAGTGPYTLGTTAIVWEQFTSTGDFTAGTGLTLSGDTVSLNIPVSVPDGGTGAESAAGALTSLGAAGTGTVNTFADDQRFASGRPWFDVTSSAFAGGADPSGGSDSTAAFNAAILAATGSAAPAANTRVAAGPVFIPAGTYKISSDLLIQSVEGFQFLGAGADCTTLVATGTGFTTAVINIDGSLDGTYGGFQIRGAGGEGAGGSGIPSAVNLTWTTAAQRSTSANTLRNIRIRNLNFIAGITQAAPASTTRQVDGTTLQDIVITGGQTAGSWSNSGNWQQGFVFGNGTSGNQYNYALYNCSAGDCYYGWYCASSGFELYGAQPAGNYCDFYLSSPGAQVNVQGVQSQNAQMLVTGAGGSGTVTVSFRDIDFKGWYTSSPPGGKWVSIGGGAAAWEFSSVLCWTGGSSGYAPVVAITGSGAPAVATFTNLQQSASLTAGFSLSSLVAGSSVTCVNYVQLGTSAPTVAAVFPLWAYAGGTWAQAATGLPLAVASGGSGSNSAAGSPAYAAKASSVETVIYVSQSGSDSNDGLSWGSAKATIAGAITALGTTGSGTTITNNPGLIQLGTGTWTDTSTHTITSVKGFTIQGLGQDKTQIMGPDGAAWILAVNCQRFKLRNLTYQGSPSGTGWGYESQAYWLFGSGVWQGGNNIGPTMNGAENVTFGRSATPAAAYGVRFTINSVQSDGNNDEGLFVNCYFLNCVQAISVEHSNSLQHIFLNPRFGACGGCIAFQGGSANLINPVVGGGVTNAYGNGYIVDFQPAVGNFNTAGSGTPSYKHDIDIFGVENESNLAWVRSQTISTNGTLRCKWTGGNLGGQASGGDPSTAGYWVNWQAAQATTYLSFTNMTMGTSSETTSQVYGSASGAYLGMFNCSLTIDNYNWAGVLEQDHCLFQLGGTPSITIGASGFLKVDGLAQGPLANKPTAVAFGGGWYYTTDTTALYYSNGVNWTLILEGVLPNATNIQWFASSGTWTQLPDAVAVDVLLCGPGGGGGGGARGPSGDVICGGGGGAAGAMTHRTFVASELGATESVSIGVGGTGGAAASGDSMPGGIGGGGGSTSFGTLCFALAGNPGSGGTFGTSAGTGTGGVATTATYAPSGSGGTCTNGGAGGGSNNAAGPSSGGAGGGISSGPTAHNGGATGYSVAGTSANTGAAGIVDTSLPGGGTPPTVEGTPGCGGAGGAASVNATSYSFTATSASPCVFTAAGSAYLNGATLTLTGGSLPAGFATATTYYVVSASGATFELSASSGGSPINSTSTGSGTVNGTGAQNGANASAGGGGGGGGASLNGNASGEGGTGGNGFALVITYF